MYILIIHFQKEKFRIIFTGTFPSGGNVSPWIPLVRDTLGRWSFCKTFTIPQKVAAISTIYKQYFDQYSILVTSTWSSVLYKYNTATTVVIRLFIDFISPIYIYKHRKLFHRNIIKVETANHFYSLTKILKAAERTKILRTGSSTGIRKKCLKININLLQ